MKRKSILLLIAILAVAISLPMFSLAESATEAPDGIVAEDTQLDASDIFIGDDGYCYLLDENGEAQRVYARGEGGRFMALRNENSAYCWALDTDDAGTARQTRRNSTGRGRGCPRWN